jgi:hypothetical protein
MKRDKLKNILLENPLARTIRWIFRLLFIMLIKIYQYLISPLMPRTCRYTPSCSQYAIEAFRKHGVIKAIIFSSRRIISCNPWGGEGEDPVPPKGAPVFKFKNYKI